MPVVRVAERDVRDLFEQGLHVVGKPGVVADELGVVFVELGLGVDRLLVVRERALGDLDEYAGVVVALAEVECVLRLALEDEAGELAREARAVACKDAGIEVVVVDGVQEALHRRRAERLEVGERAADETREERLRVRAERDLRLQVARSEDRRELAVLALHQLRLLSEQVERLGLLRVRRVHLECHLEEVREVVLKRDGGHVALVDGVLALAAVVLRRQEVGKRTTRGEERKRVRQLHRVLTLAPREGEGRLVHADARLLVAAGHRGGLLRRREVLGAHGGQRLGRHAHAARRIAIEQRAHMLARQGLEAGRENLLHLGRVVRELRLGRDAELRAHLVDPVLRNAAVPQGRDERLLHLDDALR